MESSVVTTKGQLVIPARIRQKYGIKKGIRVCFLERDGEILLRPMTDSFIESVKGSLKTDGKVLKTLQEDKKRDHS